MSISRLSLTNFRSYDEFTVQCPGRFVFIIGPNGAGKSNILEAISLIPPGRGMRSAKPDDIQNIHAQIPWSAYFELADDLKIGVGRTPNSSRRTLRINGATCSKQSSILEHLRVVWITPSLDGILSDSPANRRRFIDRLTYNFFPEHANIIAEYEHCQKQRYSILKSGTIDDIWLSQIEHEMATRSIKISNNRHRAIGILNDEISKFKTPFTKPHIAISGFIDENLDNANLLEMIKAKLKTSRELDTRIKRTSFNVHRIELITTHQAKNIQAKYCSTGEQKAMVVSMILAQIHVIKKLFDGKVVVLLDDIFSHLDNMRREQLLDELRSSEVQCFITTTDDTLQLDDASYIKLS